MKPYFETELGKLYCGDCLEVMPKLDTKADMILCDLPYGTTACSWDIIIPFNKLWENYNKLTNDNSAILLTASQPFTTKLIYSNFNDFRYELIWDKTKCSIPLLAKKQPLKIHENICIFYKKLPKYNPIMTRGKPRKDIKNKIINGGIIGGKMKLVNYNNEKGHYYPTSILTISNADHTEIYHPTQKSINLFSYLIATYSDRQDLILDNCMGSGTTAVACEKLSRKWIGIEISEKYCEIAARRIDNEARQGKLF